MKFFITLLMLFSVQSQVQATEVKPVDYVEVERYLGKWYEIASFPQRFQKGCTATTATYTLIKPGKLGVLNECRLHTPDGKLKSGKAFAWVMDEESNAKLRVQFFLRHIRIGLFQGDYWIIDLDEDYQWAVVGEPTKKYLWILSRQNKLDSEVYEGILKRLNALGYDLSKLKKTIY
jgi:apolipoprotein D and lipocalin family protein